ncbi:Nn.00g083720.m01.CDS01 [Neocucurbitaria sp. VM-36]
MSELLLSSIGSMEVPIESLPPTVHDTGHRSFKSLAPNQAAATIRQTIPTPQPQPASELLSLPTELRLMICRYMTLSPASPDSLMWKGAYFACQQLHKDMRDELEPEKDLARFIVSHHVSQVQTCCQSTIKIGLSCPRLNLIREITIHTPIPGDEQVDCWHDALSPLYALYLNHLYVILTGSDFNRLPYHDLKSWGPGLFIKYVFEGRVHCKKVTFTIDELANVEGGKEQSTEISNVVPKTRISYLLNIVQDKVGRQTERGYSSEVRFRPLPFGD